ncbi:MAG: porin family protein [Chroococcus sp. CMT-3BRIN-NPC107]|nr:porin family protein [Chroococcus sp. CMT-3BRIN-NPC107]
MKSLFQQSVKIAALSALLIAPLLSAQTASARPSGTKASYLGAGVSTGLTNGGQSGDAATFGGNIQGRLAIPNTPVSARGAILCSDETSAIMPIISYDIPVTNKANAYLGAGYSFVEANGKPTPLGNKNSVVLTTGLETEVTKNIMFYTDAKLGIKAYENSPASAVSFQAGAAYRF